MLELKGNGKNVDLISLGTLISFLEIKILCIMLAVVSLHRPFICSQK